VGTGSTDSQWQLAVDSPAEGVGVGGVDCGMFGGNDPYVLSGIPPIPTITHFFAPSTASQASGLNVELKAKARN
ncbi:MAG: right-handed parallel beta-helix repeat-containing protein, partial [bacterium]